MEYVYQGGVRDFYTGGAVGFDPMAAKAVILLKMRDPAVKLHILIPCKDQTARWSDAQRSTYDFLVSKADDVEYVSEEYKPTCMKKRNQRLCDVCDVLIAYSGRYGSGSAQTVRMAQKQGKTIYNLYGKF